MPSQPQTPNGNDADPDLESWSAVEGELKTHDQQMVKDYAEDVDNLLVFAGLFSAVLTAFLVESYKMLQEDNEETNKYLLARISTQLESFSLTPGFANATRLGSLPPPFTPSRAALWINALWFLSLIFSLSAAFFGIRVRQWLREYMQWCAALVHPRENVHLRQIRFTDLQRWRVFGSISVIPGLLELALVLFVSGIVIFLWTIDSTVAIVITVASSVFLAVASTITILPAFLKRCPYKSPTAWVFVLLFSPAANALYLFGEFLSTYNGYRHSTEKIPDSMYKSQTILGKALQDTIRVYKHTRSPRTWRERDFEGGYVQSSRALVSAMLGELSNYQGTFAWGYWSLRYETMARKDKPALLFRLSEVKWLSEALGWVRQSSQDSRILQHVRRCSKSAHTPLTLDSLPKDSSYVFFNYLIPHLADLYAMVRTPISTKGRWNSTSTKDITRARSLSYEVRQIFGMHDVTNDTRKFSLAPTDMLLTSCDLRYWQDEDTIIVSYIHVEDLRRAILAVIRDNIEVICEGLPANHVLDLVAALTRARPLAKDCREVAIECFNLYQENSEIMLRELQHQGIKAALFQLTFDDGFVEVEFEFDERGRLTRRANTPTYPVAYGDHEYDFLMSFVRSRGDVLDDPDDMRIFVVLTHQWLQGLTAAPSSEDRRIAVLEQVTLYAEAARTHGFYNCGSIADLPWFEWYDDDAARLWPLCEGAVLEPFRRLLDSMQRSKQLGLLTGDITTRLPFLRLVARTVPQDVRGDEDWFKAWAEIVPRDVEDYDEPLALVVAPENEVFDSGEGGEGTGMR